MVYDRIQLKVSSMSKDFPDLIMFNNKIIFGMLAALPKGALVKGAFVI